MRMPLFTRRRGNRSDLKRAAASRLTIEQLETRIVLSSVSPASSWEPVSSAWDGQPVIDFPAAQAQQRIATTDDPANHEVSAGAGLGGVVKLSMGFNGLPEGNIGSGVLLPTGKHVLTAAHCVTGTLIDSQTGASVPYEATSGTVSLVTPGGDVVEIPLTTQFHVHPDWDSATNKGADIAIIELELAAPDEIGRYGLYRHTDELSQETLLVGYGNRGTGEQGEDPGTFGTQRWGWNRYDTLLRGTELVYDFDNGLPENDALARFGIPGTGLGIFEASSTHGDSGGPTFIDGLIAGITSGGLGADEGILTDVTDKTDSSFGEISVTTRVSSYAGWIDQVVGVKVLDEEDASLSPENGWKESSLGGFLGDSKYARTANAQAAYIFTDLSPGWYEVSVNTPGHEYNVSSAIYTITGAAQTSITSLDQRPGTNGWYTLDTVYVTGNELHVTAGQGWGLRADAVRVVPVDGYQVIDNDSHFGSTYREEGSWQLSSLPGFGGTSRYTSRGSAIFTFDGLEEDAWYEVAVNTPGHQYSTNLARYTITSGSSEVVTMLDQRPGTDGWLVLDDIQAQGNSLTVRVTNDGSGALRSDALGMRQITPPTYQTLDAEAAGGGYTEVSGNWLPSNKGYLGGSRSTYSPNGRAKYTFDDLAPGRYEVLVNYLATPYESDSAAYTIRSGGNVTGVTVDQRPGTNGWMTLDAIDVEQGNLEIEVAQKGTGGLRTDGVRIRRVAELAKATIDDDPQAGSGYTETGAWITSGLVGYQGDSRYTYNGEATYQFEDVVPGWYEVLVTVPATEYSTNRALYTISSDGGEVVTALDQRFGTQGWRVLETVEVTGDTLEINVRQGGPGALRADGVRIHRLESFFDVYERELETFLSQAASGANGIREVHGCEAVLQSRTAAGDNRSFDLLDAAVLKGTKGALFDDVAWLYEYEQPDLTTSGVSQEESEPKAAIDAPLSANMSETTAS